MTDRIRTRRSPGLRARRGVALVAFVALMFVAPVASATDVHLVWDFASHSMCGAAIEDMFACTLGATNYNDVVAGYHGERVTVVSSSVLPARCRPNLTTAVPLCPPGVATPAGQMFACVESALGLDLHTGDVVMYFTDDVYSPSGGYGCNIENMPLDTPTGRVTVRGGWSRAGTTCRWLQSIGLHEVMEAVTASSSDDCCNGQSFSGLAPSCVSMFGPTGTTAHYGAMQISCGPGTYSEAGISDGPRSDGLYHGEDCHPVHVTAATGSPEEVCTLGRAARTTGRCIGNDLVTCELGLHSETCEGACESAPAPHCVTFSANCTVDAPATVCSGRTAPVTVTCTNTGVAPFATGLSLVPSAPGAAAVFADPSWPSPTSAAAVNPSPVAVGGTGTFHFALRAPVVLAPVPYTLSFAFQDTGRMPYPSPLVTFDTEVAPCAMDGGTDAALDGGAADADADAGGGASHAGCGCRSARGAGGRGRAIALTLLSIAIARRRERGRRARPARTP